eukprot:448406_1
MAVVDLDDYYTKQRNDKQNDKKKQKEAANILRSYNVGGGPESLSSSSAENEVADLSNSMPVEAEAEAEAGAEKTQEMKISEPESEPESDKEVAFNFSAFRDQLEKKAKKSGAVVSLDDHYNKQRNEKQKDKKRQVEAANILRSYHSGAVVSLDDHYNKQRNEKQKDKKRQVEAANILRSYHSG